MYSSYYTPWYCWRNSSTESVKFTIGAAVKCLKCGQHNLDCSDSFLCDYCDTRYHCNNCGHSLHEDEGYYVQGDLLCEDCMNDLAVECAACGDLIYRDNAYWDEDNEEWYCSYCYRNRDRG